MLFKKNANAIFLHKMARDMNLHKGQFISIFLMAFLAVFIYAGVGAEWRGLQKGADTFYEETNLSDAWVYGNAFSAEQTDAVKDMDGITAVERRLDVMAIADFANDPQISLHFVEKGEISMPLLIDDGTFDVSDGAFDVDDTNGIWIDKRFADTHHLKPADTLTLTINGLPFTKTIRGLCYFPEQVFLSDSETITPDFSTFGSAVLSYKAFPVPEMFRYGTLLVKAAKAIGLEEKIDEALDGTYSVYLAQDDHPSVAMFHNEVLQHKMMGDIFPLVFLLIALLTMMSTMTRLVANQRTQIGTLKALGFNKNTILRHYISYGFFLALFGSLCGLIAGPLSLPYLFYPSMSGFYTLPVWKPAFVPSFVLVAGLLVALCVFVTYLVCAVLLRDTPADTLRPKVPKVFRHGFLEKTALWNRLGFNAQWNLRDATRNHVRSLMAVIGVFGCTALIVCALTMNQSMEILKIWQYEDINHYESKLLLKEDITKEELDGLIETFHGEGIMEERVELRTNGMKKVGSLLVTDNATLILPTGVDLKPITFPKNGVAITAKLAEMLGVQKGDHIEWHIYGSEDWVQSPVSIVYREPVSQGIHVGRAYLESLNLPFRTTAVLSATAISSHPDGVDTILSTTEAVAGWDDLTEAMYTLVYILILAAAVLAIVVLYNLGLLSFTEMEREMATLKVMGLTSGKLRGLLLTQNLWFSAIGFLLGIPGGIWLTKLIVAFSGDSFDFPVSLHLSVLLISFVFTFGLSILVNRMFSKKIRRLNMVESLKAME
ncbi:ABC transporter permease [Lachnospiraceae bacterium ZAX-1]